MWDKKFAQTDRKKFLHLIDYIIHAIDSGELKSGDPLPTQRDLSKKLNLSIGTITKAFKELEKLGYISGEIGRGTFVKNISSEYTDFWLNESKVPYKYNLGHFRTTELFNHTIQLNFMSGIKEVANSAELYFKLNDLNNTGSIPQKEIFKNWLSDKGFESLNHEWLSILPDQIASLNILIHALSNVGDTIIMEEVGDRMTNDQIISASRQVEYVSLDDNGILPDSLDEIIKRSKAKLLITNPTLHNPTSLITPAHRKKEIVSVCKKHNVIILEDGKLDLLLPKRIKSYYEIDNDISVYLSGFFFHINPALTTSFALANVQISKRIDNQFKLTYWTPSHYLIEATCNMLSTGRADKIIAERKNLLQERNKVYDQVFGTKSNEAEVLKWLKLPNHWSSARFTQAAYESGILIRNSDIFNFRNIEQLPFVRLCNSSVHSLDDYKIALQELNSLLQTQPVGY